MYLTRKGGAPGAALRAAPRRPRLSHDGDIAADGDLPEIGLLDGGDQNLDDRTDGEGGRELVDSVGTLVEADGGLAIGAFERLASPGAVALAADTGAGLLGCDDKPLIAEAGALANETQKGVASPIRRIWWAIRRWGGIRFAFRTGLSFSRHGLVIRFSITLS